MTHTWGLGKRFLDAEKNTVTIVNTWDRTKRRKKKGEKREELPFYTLKSSNGRLILRAESTIKQLLEEPKTKRQKGNRWEEI